MITIDGGTGGILHNGTNYKSGSVLQVKQSIRNEVATKTGSGLTQFLIYLYQSLHPLHLIKY